MSASDPNRGQSGLERRRSSEEERDRKISSDRMKRKVSVADRIRKFSTQIGRTKTPSKDVMSTNLRRCLTSFDVTLLSIGHMVGSGVYVLTPTVAHKNAGPAVVISYLISGIASFLAALCYAELGVRYPRSGSAYSYTYLALGELWAFLVGWNVALENVIGLAAIARACSSYINSLAGNAIVDATDKYIGRVNSPVIDQLDFVALLVVILFVTFLSFGVQMTSGLNNAFSLINICSIILVIGVGAYFADIKNWTNPKTGGFMPYGWSGVFQGAATCFYAYIGFDSIAASGEEAKNPTKSIPLATMVSMGIAALAYIAVGAVLTLMVSYKDITSDSGLPDALASNGAVWAKTVVSIGAICGMSTGIIGSLFALTRVIYAMGDDGLLFPICAKVHPKTQIPLGSMYIFGAFAAIMSFLFNVEVLAQLMSIGTLFAYLVVSSSVIIVRYKPSHMVGGFELEPQKMESPKGSDEATSSKNSGGGGKISSDDLEQSDKSLTSDDPGGRMREAFSGVDKYLQWGPGALVSLVLLFYVLLVFAACGFLRVYMSRILNGTWWTCLVFGVLVLLCILALFVIAMHRQTTAKLGYKVPLVPLFPALSIIVNAWLIANFQALTFLRLFIWIAVGLAIYFCWGLRHSKLNKEELRRTAGLSDKPFPIQSWAELDVVDEKEEKDRKGSSKNKGGGTP